MKRTDLLRKLTEIGKAKGDHLTLVRENGPHSIYRVAGVQVSIPRHREITEITAQKIIKQAEEGKPK